MDQPSDASPSPAPGDRQPPAPAPAPRPARSRYLLPAIALVAAAVAVVVGARGVKPAAPPPPPPNQLRLEPELEELARAERLAQPRIEEAIQSFHAGKLSEDHLTFLMFSDVVPGYTRVRDSLKSIPPMPQPLQARIDAAIAYANLRAEMWYLMVRRAIGTPREPTLTPDELERLARARSAAGLDALKPPQ